VSSPASEKSPFERLLDAGVYAPLGYVLRRTEVKQDLASAGRKQVAFARSLGKAALSSLRRGVGEPKADTPSAKPSRPAAAEAAATAPLPAEPVDSTEVDGYAEMTARELIALMAGTTAAQAQWILDQENDGKKRVTVIRAATARLDADADD